MKVLLVDDHVLFREGVRMVLECVAAPGTVVLEAGDFSQALAVVGRQPDIDIVLADLSMPGMDGFSGIEALRRAAPDALVIVVSASERPEDVRRALGAGAHGYISKVQGARAMMDAVRRVLAGETFISPHLDPTALGGKAPGGRLGDRSGDRPGDRSNGPGALVHRLTPRQRDVLAMLSQGKSNKEIARDLKLAEITVKLHVTAILRALGVENRTQAAILATRAAERTRE